MSHFTYPFRALVVLAGVSLSSVALAKGTDQILPLPSAPATSAPAFSLPSGAPNFTRLPPEVIRQLKEAAEKIDRENCKRMDCSKFSDKIRDRVEKGKIATKFRPPRRVGKIDGQKGGQKDNSDITRGAAGAKQEQIDSSRGLRDLMGNSKAEVEQGLNQTFQDLTQDPKVRTSDLSHDYNLFEQATSYAEQNRGQPFPLSQALTARNEQVRSLLSVYSHLDSVEQQAKATEQRQIQEQQQLQKLSAAGELNSDNLNSLFSGELSPLANQAGNDPAIAQAKIDQGKGKENSATPTSQAGEKTKNPKDTKNLAAGSLATASTAEISEVEKVSTLSAEEKESIKEAKIRAAEARLSPDERARREKIRQALKDKLSRKLASLLPSTDKTDGDLPESFKGDLGGVEGSHLQAEAKILENFFGQQSTFAMNGSETDAYIKETVSGLSDIQAGILETDSLSLFARVKHYHEGCLRSKCVSLSAN